MSYSGGNGSGKIATSSDAALSNPVDGQALIYDGVTQKWKNVSLDSIIAGFILNTGSATYASLHGSSIDTTPPSVPSGVSVTAGNGQLSVSWVASTDNTAVAGYIIYVGGVQKGTSNLTSYTLTGLNNGTAYSVTIAAYDPAGNISAKSAAVSGTPASTSDSTPPSVPTNLAVSAGNAQLIATWTASTDNVGVTGYRVYLGGTLQGTTASTSYTITGLANGTAYQVTVAAYDAAGNLSAQASAVTGTPVAPNDTTPPSVPSGLQATAGSAQVALSWSAASDNVAVAGYRIYVGGSLKGTSSGTNYTVGSLTNGTSYSFTVAAYDAAGNVSAQSGAVSATPVAASTSIANQDIAFTSGQSTNLSQSAAISAATHVFVVNANPTAFQGLCSSNNDGGITIFPTTNNRFQVYVQNGGYITQSDASLDWTRSNIIAVEYDSTSGVVACYANGIPIGTDGRGANGFSFTSGTTVNVGSGVQEYRRYSRCLYGWEIKSLFSSLSSTYNIPLGARITATTPTPLTVSGIKGSNIMPTNDQLHGSPDVWPSVWITWNWTWISGCIDRAQARGGTVVRQIGDVQAVKSGLMTQATYNAQLTQLLNYVKSKGMKLYYTGCDLNQRGSAVQADIVAAYTEAAKILQANYANVYGFDLCNEIASTYGNLAQSTSMPWMQAAASAIRQYAPNVSISISDVGGGGGGGTLGRAGRFDQFTLWAPIVDFFDCHTYEDTLGEQQPWHLAPYEVGVDRPLNIGEFGGDFSSNGDTVVSQIYSREKALVQNTKSVACFMQWAIQNDYWGLYREGDGSLHTATAAVWDSM